MPDLSKIRNFSIVAHIDHGKSTLADRLIQFTGTVSTREMTNQILDSMDIERERGITIKAQTVRLDYKAADGEMYVLNLMDTPGHVDFGYEVSRCLAACEGALLVVDASQGVEAQTLANVYQAIDAGLDIVPVLNKIDLPAAEPDRVKAQIEDVIGIDASEAIPISAKTGIGIDLVLEAVVKRLPPPKGELNAPLKALLIDSYYDAYLGVVVLVRIIDGELKKGQKIRMMAADAVYQVEQIGVFKPKKVGVEKLGPGEVGYITAQIKQVADTKVGDTITDERKGTATALPGFKSAQQVVFCGLFPVDSSLFEDLRDAIEKLALNDASFSFEMETSAALGFGFRCGFLGLLHLEVIRYRIEREYDIDLITTAPLVVYHLHMRDGEMRDVPRSETSPRYRNGGLDALDSVIVVGAVLKLEVDNKTAVRARARDFLLEKRAAQPVTEASAGCIFKNPTALYQGEKLGAGQLIDRLGLKGLSIGKAQVSHLHGNFIVNHGGATATDVLELIQAIQRAVFDQSGIELEIEVRRWVPEP